MGMTSKPAAHFMSIALVRVAVFVAQCFFFDAHLYERQRPCRRKHGGRADMRRPQKECENGADHADEDRIARPAKEAARNKRTWPARWHADAP